MSNSNMKKILFAMLLAVSAVSVTACRAWGGIDAHSSETPISVSR